MTLPEPFASVHADDLLLDRLAARQAPASGSGDRAAEALLRLAHAADDAASRAEAMSRPSNGTDSRTGALAAEAARSSTAGRGQRHAVIASRLLVAAAASVALGLVPAAHDTRPPLPSPVLPAAPVALVRAQALVAEAQGLVAPAGAGPTISGLDRAESLLAEASEVLDGVHDPVGGTLGVDAVRARMAGVAGALAAARHRLDSPTGVVEPLRGDAPDTPTAPVAADRRSARGDGTATGASSDGPGSPATGSRHDTRGGTSDEVQGAAGSGPARTGGSTTGSTSGSTGGHDAPESSEAGHPTDTRDSGSGHDDEPESGDASESSSQLSTRDRSGSDAGSGEASDGSDSGATEPAPGVDDDHASD